jgi:hypothetical protein
MKSTEQKMQNYSMGRVINLGSTASKEAQREF